MNSAYSFHMSPIFRLGAGNSPRRQAVAAAAAQSGNFLPLHDQYIAHQRMDYSAALANAVAWLGNRYLLARPVKRLTDLEPGDARRHESANGAHLRV
jgi:hypothetical protein